jgi:excisionase family DNA binding protein
MSYKDEHIDYSPSDLLTLDEVAARIRVEQVTLEDMLRDGSLPHVMVEGEPRVHIHDLDNYTENITHGTVRMGGSNEEIDTL